MGYAIDENNHFAFSVVMNGIPNKVRTINNMKFVQYKMFDAELKAD